MAIEEGLETTGKRVTINNFFESIQDIDEIANNAIKSVTDQGSIVDGLVKSIEEIKLEIKEIKAYLMVREDEEKDRLLEAQDAEQKREMTERALSLQGVDSSDQKTAGSPEDQGVSFAENAQQKNVTNPQEQKGFFGSLAGLFGSSLLQLPAALLGAGSNNLNLVQNLNKGGEVKDNDKDTTNNNEDSVLAALTPGEFVVKKDVVEEIGVDTLKGLNAAAGGTNKPEKIKDGVLNKLLGRKKDNEIEIFEEGKKGTDLYEKTTEDFSGGGHDITTETTTREETDDGTITTTEVLRERAVSVGVPDIIQHKTQLLGEIHKLKGFEKVTIDDVINQTTGIPQDKLFEIINQSDAAKATEKKQEEAIQEDYEARNIKPGTGFSMSYDDEVAKSLQGTMGYRIGQMNPDQLVIGMDEFTSKTREVFKSAEDPKFKEAHVNAKKSGGVKGFSEGGLVGEDVVGEKLKNFAEQFKMDDNMNVNLEGLLGEEKGEKMNKVFGGFLNMIKDDVIPNMKEEKLESGAKTILQKGLSSMPVDNISDKIEKSDMPEGVKALFTDIFGGDKIEKMIEGVSTDMEGIDIFDSLIPLVEEVQSAGEGDAPPPSSESPNKNQPVLIQKSPPNVSEAEIKNSAVEEVIPFINTISNKELSTFSNEGLANFIK